jgi:hypothetical protein
MSVSKKVKTTRWAVVFAYSTEQHGKGCVLSTHKSYDLARAAAKRSGWDSFLAIREGGKSA